MRKRIGVILAQLEENMQKRFMQAFLKEAYAKDYDVCIFSMYQKFQQTELRNIGDSNIFSLINYEYFDGLLVLTDTLQTPGLEKRIFRKIKKNFGGPVITVDKENDLFEYVLMDHFSPIVEIMNHLIEVHGYKDIAFLSGREGHPHSVQRLSGYRVAMKNHNLPIREDRIYHGNYWYDSGHAFAEELLKNPDDMPEAVACASELEMGAVVAVVDAVHAHAIVGAQVAAVPPAVVARKGDERVDGHDLAGYFLDAPLLQGTGDFAHDVGGGGAVGRAQRGVAAALDHNVALELVAFHLAHKIHGCVKGVAGREQQEGCGRGHRLHGRCRDACQVDIVAGHDGVGCNIGHGDAHRGVLQGRVAGQGVDSLLCARRGDGPRGDGGERCCNSSCNFLHQSPVCECCLARCRRAMVTIPLARWCPTPAGWRQCRRPGSRASTRGTCCGRY